MEILFILICLVLSAFFSGMEIAFVTSNKLRIEVEKKQDKGQSRIISIFTKSPGQYIATMLVGNNIALVVYGIFFAIWLEKIGLGDKIHSEWILLLVQTVLSTLLILVTAEFLPKTLFRINPNWALNVFAGPIFFFYLLFWPIAIFAIWLSNSILRKIFKISLRDEVNLVFGKVDLDNFLKKSEKGEDIDKEEELDIKIFRNAMDFASVKIRECIVPRTEIVAIEVNEPLEDLRRKFIETGLSKIMIYKESIDNIIGYFHVSELFKNPKSIRSKLQYVSIVPETMAANKLLALFMQEHKSIAVVVDEFGGTSGMVTIEDIMEEIFGEIEDEHDVSELEEHQLNDNEYIFSGRLEIDYINDRYKLKLPESEEYETIAGLILFYHENIPVVNDIIEIENIYFSILKVSNTRIELIKLIISDK